jgi:hypothetical protein
MWNAYPWTLIESVDSSYLGSIVTREGGALEDVSNRIGKANSAFVQVYPVWKNSNISRKTKFRIFSSDVKAVLIWCRNMEIKYSY